MMNGQDVLCLSATGDGKSALIYLASIARKGTITLVVCPTNFLESDLVRLTNYLYKFSYFLAKLQVSSLQKKGVSAQAINAETLAAASLVGRDIWAEAKTGVYQVLLFSPETTATDEYDIFIHDEVARPRIGYFVVDEIHLVYEWGPEFRTLYETLFTMRARLPEWTVFVGLTATLEPGLETDTVIRSVGFKSNFHFEKRDCERRNVDLIIREIKYPCTGYEFHDLDWLIPPDLTKASDLPKRLVYCETIEMGHRLSVYLRSLLPPHLRKDGRKLIRHMHSLNCPQCKAEGLASLYLSGEDRDCAIFIATAVLGVGIDVFDIDSIIDYPCFSSVSALVQHAGRPARGIGRHGEAIIYIKKTDIVVTTEFMESDEYLEDLRRVPDLDMESDADPTDVDPLESEGSDMEGISSPGANSPKPDGVTAAVDASGDPQRAVWAYKGRSKKKKKALKKTFSTKKAGRSRASGTKNCNSLRFVVAAHVRRACITRQINLIYDNPGKSRNCGRCSSCKPRPVPEPRPLRSVMATANPGADEIDATASRDLTPSFMKPLVKDLEEVAHNLELAVMELRANGPYNPDMLFIGARSFLPRRMMSQITDNFLRIESEDDLKRRMEGWRYWDTYGSELWNVVTVLQSKLRDTLKARHEEKLVKQRDVREMKKQDQVRADLNAAGLGNVKRVKLVVPLKESDPTLPFVNDAVTSSSVHSMLRISDVNQHDFPAFRSGIEVDSFYASKNRKRPAPDSDPSTFLPRKTRSHPARIPVCHFILLCGTELIFRTQDENTNPYDLRRSSRSFQSRVD
jgi:superfamily II DNA or RNA helicase